MSLKYKLRFNNLYSKYKLNLQEWLDWFDSLQITVLLKKLVLKIKNVVFKLLNDKSKLYKAIFFSVLLPFS